MWSEGASCVWSATSSTLIICPEAADCLPMTSLFTLVLSAPTELGALSPSSWTCSGGGGREGEGGERDMAYVWSSTTDGLQMGFWVNHDTPSRATLPPPSLWQLPASP